METTIPLSEKFFCVAVYVVYNSDFTEKLITLRERNDITSELLYLARVVDVINLLIVEALFSTFNILKDMILAYKQNEHV